MTRGLGTDWQNALDAAGIRTCWLARFDFLSETIRVTTAEWSLAVSGTGDTALDGGTFDPLGGGSIVQIGENNIQMGGSEALTLSLAIPASPSTAIAASSVYPSEYQARKAYIWRGLQTVAPGAGTEGTWAFKRIRSGRMDTVSISDDGKMHLFNLTVESFAALMSQASGSTYLDQKKIDTTDTALDYAVSIANGRPQPSSSGAVPGNTITLPGGGSFTIPRIF